MSLDESAALLSDCLGGWPVSVVLELQSSDLQIEDVYRDLVFPEGREGRPYVAINVASTADGKATVEGRANKVGSEIDHKLMRRVRAAADMILIGARTLRKENVSFTLPPDLQRERVTRGLSPVPLAAVLSASGELPLDRSFFQSKEFQSMVFVTESAEPRRLKELEEHARVLVVGERTVDLNDLLGILRRDMGVKRLLVEGGPGLNHAFIQSGLVDELFLTLSPKIVAGREISPVEGARFPGDGVAQLQLVSAYAYRSELFLRFRFLAADNS